MGLISRMKRITRGKIEAFLDAVESPEVILPQLAREMAEKVKQAANAEAKALTVVRSAQRKVDEAAGRAARMQRGAELALTTGDVDTARQAVAAQIEAEREIERIDVSLATAKNAYAEAGAVRRRLSADLADLRHRKNEILHRARAAAAQRTAQRAAGPTATSVLADGQSILDAVARMEAKVGRAETDADVQTHADALLAPTLPDERIDELLKDQEVQRRLEELKRRSAS